VASFRLVNTTKQTIYYEGTPFPVYAIERKSDGGWSPDSDLPPLEVLYPVFPGKSYVFSIPLPETTNNWRLAMVGLKPSKAPVLLRRYFRPSPSIWRSPEIASVPPTRRSTADPGQLASSATAP
jgi:hypothetical protein